MRVTLGLVAELLGRKLQARIPALVCLLITSTFVKLEVSLQSQARYFLETNGSNGVWLTEKQWCWLTVLANGNGSGVTAAISAERAPTQQSALDWQQHARRPELRVFPAVLLELLF